MGTKGPTPGQLTATAALTWHAGHCCAVHALRASLSHPLTSGPKFDRQHDCPSAGDAGADGVPPPSTAVAAAERGVADWAEPESTQIRTWVLIWLVSATLWRCQNLLIQHDAAPQQREH